MSGLEALVASGFIVENVALGPLTTYKSGGPARYLIEVENLEDLERLTSSDVLSEMPLLMLGRGSNIVVSDSGFPGLVIRLGPGFSKIEIDGSVVSAGGSAPLAQVARASVKAGLTGLEFFVGIPGSVGGAVRQNAGCFGVETKDRLIEASILDLASGVIGTRSPDDLEMSYRHSNIDATRVVLTATFATRPGDVAKGLEELRRITRWRRDNQPGGTFNAGSVFKNPPGATAGELIDSLGLKGTKVGDVAVSSKHANFFVAGPNATSGDIRRLVDVVKDRVFEETGTILEPEIQFVGFEDDN
ncbi:MAG TPA: UDP-N-acetylmuramate dehydrogenase [Acidimicrobiia bacterium]|nr:UDP-N-acetylmuramate dehydrogenase [Acidimicrobiia bacterium]